MVKLIIEDDEGRKTVVPLIRQEITIGRQEGNTIRLTERNISRHHARLFRQNGSILVEDLGSYNGIRLNGERIEGKIPVRDGDLIEIGDYDLAIRDDSAPQPSASPSRQQTAASAEAITAPERPIPTAARPPPPPSASPPPLRSNDQGDRPAQRQVIELDPEHAPRLVLLNTEHAGRELACARTDLRIGSSEQNDISIADPSLARTHARLLLGTSGEWQVIDLQSSNDVLVNGEAYGKAMLRSGDILQLGEVKLRFIGPVEAFGAGTDELAARTGEKLKPAFLFVGIAVIAAVGLILLLTARPSPPKFAEPPRAVARVEPAPAEPPVAKSTAPTEEARPPPVTASTERPEPAPSAPPASSEPAAPAPASKPRAVDLKVRAANAAMQRRDFQKAVDTLEPLKNPDGTRPAEVEDGLNKATAELKAKKKLAQAQKSLAGGKVDDALRLLDESNGTTAFAKEHQQLKARADATKQSRERRASKEKDLKLASAAKPTLQPKDDSAAPPQLPAADEPQKFYEEGAALYRKGQFPEAATALNQCLKIDPSFARCHMVLGATYARLHEPELGAQHYRRFLQLAPGDPDSTKVKLFLEQYESARGVKPE